MIRSVVRSQKWNRRCQNKNGRNSVPKHGCYYIPSSYFVLCCALMVASCTSVAPKFAPDLPQSNRPCVIVVDGAGDYRACSHTIRATAEQDGLPCEVVTFVWSHGYLRNIVDHTDFEHTQTRGAQLTQLIQSHKLQHPDAPISLVGHSAGSAVVLAATEVLPPGTIDHVILLAPSISEDYDIQPALARVNRGVELFVSADDWIWLGVLVRLFGTTDDPLATRAAGQYGFHLPEHVAMDAASGNASSPYAKLHVHQWCRKDAKCGHNGGHFGCYQPGFLRERVFPIICPK